MCVCVCVEGCTCLCVCSNNAQKSATKQSSWSDDVRFSSFQLSLALLWRSDYLLKMTNNARNIRTKKQTNKQTKPGAFLQSLSPGFIEVFNHKKVHVLLLFDTTTPSHFSYFDQQHRPRCSDRGVDVFTRYQQKVSPRTFWSNWRCPPLTLRVKTSSKRYQESGFIRHTCQSWRKVHALFN